MNPTPTPTEKNACPSAIRIEVIVSREKSGAKRNVNACPMSAATRL